MFEIRKSIEIDAAHRVPFHESKCRHLHGHRYQITAILRSEELVSPESDRRSDAGMVADFGVVKESLVRVIHDQFDHKLILWKQDPLLTDIYDMLRRHRGLLSGLVTIPVIPTAEELAKYWGQLFWTDVFESFRGGITLDSFTVRETPTSFATHFF